MIPTDIRVVQADYHNTEDAAAIVTLMNAYALDPMGGGKALSPSVQKCLVEELSKRPYAFSVLAYVDGRPAGLVNCFEAFSTFACRPLVNIHDLVVDKAYRGLGLSRSMLEKVEEIASVKGCCKLTIEVLEGNEIAWRSYTGFGFMPYELDPKMGTAQFLQKVIP
ncbi:GNAT family N-acetyltransferase [Sulfurovum riftiae]|uniref:GNAT family acetyltransferase n=1 Tax=Sulfurovum riftiae TaxID=1630136 RepID=A0A151CJT6_9BACT|nr:GNAT family N-acetyltransferase [Sulfurovum riftiae]KYJ87694.1 GNAT family acetyltransferase [Sulfurovum riftiae]